MDREAAFEIIYLDFAKVFDKVPHRLHASKMTAHSWSGEAGRWEASWLTGRHQRVILNGKFSTWEDVLPGGPKGSLLGPFLFVIFINNIGKAIKKTDAVKNFAHDTKMGKRIMSDQDRTSLQEALDAVSRWLESWGM